MLKNLLATTRVRSLLALACGLMLLVLPACDGGGNPVPTATFPGAANTPRVGEVPPDATTPTAVPSPVGLDESARIGVYAQLVASLLKSNADAEFVFVSPYIGQGERLDNPDENTPVPAGLVEQLEGDITSRKFEVRDFMEAVGALEDGGRVKNRGIFVTLGPIVNTSSDPNVVTARASIYRMVGEARGDVYRFQRDAGERSGWKLLGVTEEWNDKSAP